MSWFIRLFAYVKELHKININDESLELLIAFIIDNC
jgi:hypothetical protein